MKNVIISEKAKKEKMVLEDIANTTALAEVV